MRLTIIPEDYAVYVDLEPKQPLYWEGTPADVHALQWFSVEGWIEFKDGRPNQPLTELPEWANNAVAAWEQGPPPPPPPTAEENKDTAMGLLQDTDWTALPDVSDPLKSNPYLVNAEEFNVYRNVVRQYAINPVAGHIEFPTVPQAVWQSAP